ncbi:MAG: S41 family peptidase [Bacteroidales bacterium]|nr:S41 family peptidase [Bacteroidales bacterium]
MDSHFDEQNSSGKTERFFYYCAIVATLIFVVFFFLYMRDRQTLRQYANIAGNNSSKLNTVYRVIERYYVDTLDWKKLEEDAIATMLKELDPHSAYLPKDKLQASNEVLEGNFSGVGIQYQMFRDTVVVLSVIPKGPSDQAGLQAGDRIIAVNDSVIAGVSMSVNDIPNLLKGPAKTTVRVTLRRPSNDSTFQKIIFRGPVPLPSIDVVYMYDENTGYIKLNKFSRTTQAEFLVAVELLKRQHMRRLILDLRDNTGGYLEAAIGLLGEIFPKDSLLVYTEGRARARKEYRGSGHMACRDIDLAVLIDEATASASEIVAGAIQDYERGIIVGRRSYGKGLVQEQMTMRDGSALRLTVARYYTPLGRCIQKPYTPGDEESYNREIYGRFAHGELTRQDSIKNDTVQIVYTRQSHRALYGGGGIVPDLFVPLDTSYYSPLITRISRQGTIINFAFEYADPIRSQLAQYKDWRSLLKALDEDDIWVRFKQYAVAHGLRPTDEEWRISGDYLKSAVIAGIARHMMGDKGFYPVANRSDRVVEEAFKALKNRNK